MYVETNTASGASGEPKAFNSGYAVRISLIAALGGFLFGFETAVISGAEKTIQQLWNLSSGWQGFTVASSLIGTVIGSLVAGMPAQRYGRKKVLTCHRYFILAVCYRLCVHAGLAIVHHLSFHRRHCGRRFLGGRADVYFRSIACEDQGKAGRLLPVDDRARHFRCFSYQFFVCGFWRRRLALDARHHDRSRCIVCGLVALHSRKPALAGAEQPR